MAVHHDDHNDEEEDDEEDEEDNVNDHVGNDGGSLCCSLLRRLSLAQHFMWSSAMVLIRIIMTLREMIIGRKRKKDDDDLVKR